MENMITDKREITSIVSMQDEELAYTVGEHLSLLTNTIEKIVAYTEVDGTLWAAVYCKRKIQARVPLANYAVYYALSWQ